MPSKPTKSMVLAAQAAFEAFPVIDEMFLDRAQHGDVDRRQRVRHLRGRAGRRALLRREADGALFLFRACREERDEDEERRGGDHERG